MGFGVELEYPTGDWTGTTLGSNDIYTMLTNSVAGLQHSCRQGESKEHWSLKSDCSVGWEITSPILALDQSGIDQLDRFVKQFEVQITDFARLKSVSEAIFNHFRAGFHIHVGKEHFESSKHISNLVRFFIMHEKTILDLQPDHRKTSHYVHPMNRLIGYAKQRCSEVSVNDYDFTGDCNVNDDHYGAVNINGYHKTIEFRQGVGSVYADRILGWTKFIFLTVEMARANNFDLSWDFVQENNLDNLCAAIKEFSPTKFAPTTAFVEDLKHSSLDWIERYYQKDYPKRIARN